jgi:hypothetical protein
MQMMWNAQLRIFLAAKFELGVHRALRQTPDASAAIKSGVAVMAVLNEVCREVGGAVIVLVTNRVQGSLQPLKLAAAVIFVGPC